jgi:hypothetical protein
MRAVIPRATLAVAFALSLLMGTARAVTVPDVPRRITISIYPSEAAANAVMDALKDAKDRGDLDLESRELITKSAKGRSKGHDRRTRETRSGQAVAAIAGVMGAKTGIGAGASAANGADFLTSNRVGMTPELVDSLKVALGPGDAAVVSSVGEKSAAVAAQIQAEGATRVLTHDIPALIAQPPVKRVPPTPPIPSEIFPSTIP